MLTSEQRLKAELKLLDKRFEDIKRERAKADSEQARKGMKLYGLPYRIYLDYIKVGDGIRKKNGEISLSEIYPLQGYPVDDVRVIKYPSDFDNNKIDAYVQSCPLNSDGKRMLKLFPTNERFIDDGIKAELEQLHTELISKYKSWDVYGGEWEYLFLRFLDGYDFNTFGEFEFYGTVGKYNDADINNLRKQYTALQGKYKANKGKYLGIPTYDTDNEEQYFNNYYRIVWE